MFYPRDPNLLRYGLDPERSDCEMVGEGRDFVVLCDPS